MGSILDGLGRITTPKAKVSNGWVGPRPETGLIARGIACALALVAGSGAFLGAEDTASAREKYATAGDGETTTLEALDLTVTAKVNGGMLEVLIGYGGLLGGTKVRKIIPLAGVPPEVVAQLEDNGEFTLRMVGENHDGTFKGRIDIDAEGEFAIPEEVLAAIQSRAGVWHTEQRTLIFGGPPVAEGPIKASPKSIAAAPPPPPPPPSPPEGLVKPYDPGTFFVSPATESASMGADQPRGYDVEQGKGFTLYITGNATAEIELYPWVPVKAAERAKYGPINVKVFVDGVEMELPPQDLAKGQILKSSQNGAIALWNNPIIIPTMAFGHGTHEITVLAEPFWVRAVLVGATPTSTPNTRPALEVPFQDDPHFPAQFEFHGEVTGLGSGDYKLKPLTTSPVKLKPEDSDGMKVEVIRIPEDSRVRIKLTKGTATPPGSPDYIEYESQLIEPGAAYNIAFTRVSPPARSTDMSGPDAMPIYLNVTGSGTTGYNATIDDAVHDHTTPPDLTCKVTNVKNPRNNKVTRALAWCWEKTVNGVRALRTTIDTRPASNPPRKLYRLEKY